jgi:hypothetical protein
MGGGFIGGDSSVQWEMFGDNVDNSHESVPVGNHGRKHAAIDQTPAGGTFEIVIDKDAIQTGGGIGTGQDFKFTLAIKYNQRKQIQVYWESTIQASPLNEIQKTLRGEPSEELMNATERLGRARK